MEHSAQSFLIWSDELERRLDPIFYRPEIRALLKKLESTKTYKLGELMTEMAGGATPKVTEDFYLEESGVPFLRVQNIAEEGIDLEDVKYIKPEVHETALKRSQLKKDDLVFTITGRIGSVAVVPEGFIGNINQHSVRLHLKEEIDGTKILPKFVAAFFNTEIGRQLSLRKVTGGTRPALDYVALKNLPVPIPSLEKQNKVVQKIEKVYAEKREKEEEIKKILASIDAYVLGELGIVSIAGGVQQIFQIWSDEVSSRLDPYYFQPMFKVIDKIFSETIHSVGTLKQLAIKITSGSTPLSGGEAYTDSDNGVPFVRSGDIDQSDEIDFGSLLYLKSEVHTKKLKGSQLKRGDLLIAIVGATIGQVAIYADDREANINQALALVRLSDRINPEYVKEFFYSRIGQVQLEKAKRPVARANINLDEIGGLKIIYPSRDKQDEMVTKIRRIRDNAKQMRQEAESAVTDAQRQIEQMILA